MLVCSYTVDTRKQQGGTRVLIEEGNRWLLCGKDFITMQKVTITKRPEKGTFSQGKRQNERGESFPRGIPP